MIVPAENILSCQPSLLQVTKLPHPAFVVLECILCPAFGLVEKEIQPTSNPKFVPSNEVWCHLECVRGEGENQRSARDVCQLTKFSP